MPYEYRQLTPEEREEAVRQRREQGYPLHAPPHSIRGEHCYLLSAANYEHFPIMAVPERRTAFERRLLSALVIVHTEVIAWVVLPNHYHALVNVGSLASMSAALQGVHGSTSREWNLADGETRKRKVWYHFTDRAIRNQSHFIAALNYIHYNPVKHRYVDDAYDWPWSSLENYLETQGREWLRAQWRTNPPGDMGRGWDDF
jgi:putative transposase